jgi:hypothetical protein
VTWAQTLTSGRQVPDPQEPEVQGAPRLLDEQVLVLVSQVWPVGHCHDAVQ